MNEQPEALRLADELENGECFDVGSCDVVYGWLRNDPTSESAYELRRLHAENERLREALHDISISQNSMYQEARAKQALGEDQNIWRMCGLNTDDVIKMAEEAGIVMSLTDDRVTLNKLNRFLELHLKALKNEGYRKCAEESAELLQALQNLHQRCHWADAPEEMDAAKAAIEKAIRARGD